MTQSVEARIQPSAPPPEKSRITYWLAGGLVLCLIAVAVLAVVASRQESRRSGTSGEYAAASASVVALLDKRIATFNAGDSHAAAATYTENGILEELEPPWPPGKAAYTIIGREGIEKRLRSLYQSGLRIEAVGKPVQMGVLVAEPTKFRNATDPSGYGEGILVFQIKNGLIAHQWMIGWAGTQGDVPG
jgi:hypothetical protein